MILCINNPNALEILLKIGFLIRFASILRIPDFKYSIQGIINLVFVYNESFLCIGNTVCLYVLRGNSITYT